MKSCSSFAVAIKEHIVVATETGRKGKKNIAAASKVCSINIHLCTHVQNSGGQCAVSYLHVILGGTVPKIMYAHAFLDCLFFFLHIFLHIIFTS